MGEALSGVNVSEMVCEVVPTFAIPSTVFQFEDPCGPLGANGKNNSDGALVTGTALVTPMSAPPGSFVVRDALIATFEVIETRSVLSSSFTSPSRKEPG